MANYEDRVKYAAAEKKGRAKLAKDYADSRYQIEYVMTEGDYDPIDSFCTAYTESGAVTYANEVKDRDILLELYAKDGLILELSKYDALMDAYLFSGYTPYYINYFKDARVVWDVRKIANARERVIEKDCTQTTATNYQKGKKKKKVILIYPEEGIIRRYKGE